MSEREELINVIWGTGDIPEQTAIEIADAVIGWQADRAQGESHWIERANLNKCQYHGDDREACATYSGQIPCERDGAQGGEAVADFKAEIRTERDICDEYVSSLVFISGGKASPYLYIPESLDQDVLDEAVRRLNTQPAPSVPEGWRIKHIDDPVSDGYSVHGPGINYCVWKDKEAWLYMFLDALSEATTPQPADGWIPCSERLPSLTGWYCVALTDPDDVGWSTAVSWAAFWNGDDFEECDPVVDGQPVTHWMPFPNPPEQGADGHE